jgi:subtilisin family serine protease
MPRHRIFFAALAVPLVLSTSGSPATQAPVAEVGASTASAIARNGATRVIVAFREPAARRAGTSSFAQITETTRALRDRVLARVGAGNGFAPTATWDTIAAVPGFVTAEGLRRLARDPEVLRVDLDRGGRASDAESLSLIGGDVAHTNGFTGKGVTVAILDTGIDETHPDLVDSIADEHCFVIPNGCPNGTSEQSGPGSARDEHGHGTNVAGIVTSNGTIAPVGVAPDAKVVVVRVLDKDARFQTLTQILSALNWIALNHPEVRAVNMSLGTDQLFMGACDNASAGTVALASAINSLRARGALLFAASGNRGAATSMAAPACVEGAVSVGAVYDASIGGATFPGVCSDPTTDADRVTCFSNGGSALDLLAPGAIIDSTGLGGGVSTYLGTSQASPHAAGAATLLIQSNPALTPDQVESLLKSTGRSITDPRTQVTTPRVDVAAALNLAAQPPPAPPPPDTTEPSAHAIRGTYRPSSRIRLVFTLRDNTGRAQVVDTIFTPKGKTLAKLTTRFLSNADGRARFVVWRVPKAASGTLKHCVQATDRAGNTSSRSCATLRRSYYSSSTTRRSSLRTTRKPAIARSAATMPPISV